VTYKAFNSFDKERVEHPVLHSVSPAYPAIAPPSSSFCHPESSIMIDGHFEGSLTKKQAHHSDEEGHTKGGQSSYISYTMACDER
jgi:hypothetical protein